MLRDRVQQGEWFVVSGTTAGAVTDSFPALVASPACRLKDAGSSLNYICFTGMESQLNEAAADDVLLQENAIRLLNSVCYDHFEMEKQSSFC